MKRNGAKQFETGRAAQKSILATLLVMGMAGLLGGATHAEVGTTTPRIVAYYHSRVRNTYPYTQVDYSQMTHLAHSFVWPTKDGALDVPSGFLYPELVQAAHAHGVKVIVSVGGGSKSGNFAAMSNDSAARTRFVRLLTSFCLSNYYDGADIDWETPTNATESANFTLLVHELRAAFNAADPRLTSLSAAVPKSPKRAKWLDIDAIKNDLDWLGVMGYAWHGTWSKHAGHNAPLYGSTADPDGPAYCTDASIKYYLSRGIPKEKLLFGIPLYARQFNATNLYANSTGGDWIPYSDVQHKLSEGWTRIWDDTAKVPYLLNPEHTQFVTYEDPQSIREKCDYVSSHGLGGVILWSLGQDLYRGEAPLLSVVGQNLLGRTNAVNELTKHDD
jgi:chitinase